MNKDPNNEASRPTLGAILKTDEPEVFCCCFFFVAVQRQQEWLYPDTTKSQDETTAFLQNPRVVLRLLLPKSYFNSRMSS